MPYYKCYRDVSSSGFTPLMHAVMSNNLDEIKRIICNCPEEINKKNDRGWTALMLAAANSRADSSEEAVRLLIDAGCDLDLQEEYGYTALMHAVRFSNTNSSEATVKMLIDAGCNIHLYDRNYSTALILAKNNNKKIIMYMLKVAETIKNDTFKDLKNKIQALENENSDLNGIVKNYEIQIKDSKDSYVLELENKQKEINYKDLVIFELEQKLKAIQN